MCPSVLIEGYRFFVIPVLAGIQLFACGWIPDNACSISGTTLRRITF